MNQFLESFLIAFIPIFVAMDTIGVIPIYIGLSKKIEKDKRRIFLLQAITTAGVIGMIFVLLGTKVFAFLGITVADFKIAGGLILVILSIMDLLFEEKHRQQQSDMSGVVPLGMPLIAGPATLTTLIVHTDVSGFGATTMAFLVNLALAFVGLALSNQIVRVLGKSGTQAISKVANLLMAAIGVMIIRVGITEVLTGL